MCCVGFVFTDSLKRSRTLQCENGNTWNDTLPNCVNISLTAAWKSAGSSWKLSDENVTVAEMAVTGSMDSDTIFNVIVPTVIMALLFVGNAAVLYVLFMLRRRNKKKLEADEERAAIVRTNGSAKMTDAEGTGMNGLVLSDSPVAEPTAPTASTENV